MAEARTGANRAQLHYTDYFITVNTNKAPKEEAEKEELTQALYAAVRKFGTPAVLREVLIQERPNELKRAVLTNAAVETGGKMHRLHVHFNISILHGTKLLMMKQVDGRRVGINQIVANYFTSELQLGTAVHARVSLASSTRAKNYAIKKGATQLNDFRVTVGAGALKGKWR